MDINEIFQTASRMKFRFDSPQGELTTEQLWDLPLTSTVKNKADLDTVARMVNAQLKAITDESFVETKVNPLKPQLTLKLELVKHIIGVRQAENAAKVAAAQNASKIALLREALEARSTEALKNQSPEELEAQIKALGG